MSILFCHTSRTLKIHFGQTYASLCITNAFSVQKYRAILIKPALISIKAQINYVKNGGHRKKRDRMGEQMILLR